MGKPTNRKSECVYRNSHTLDWRLRRILSRAKSRAKLKEWSFDLDLDFLTDLYLAQNGRCALSDIPFVWGTLADLSVPHDPFMPSLDRIDSRKGYTRDNVQLVCWAVNDTKSHYSEREMARLYKNIVLKYISKEELRAAL